jgi:hypothetical protein
MKPTDKNLELIEQLKKADIEVLGAKPGHATARVVFTDGEGDKPDREGAFIGKNDHMAGIDAMLKDFINSGEPSKFFRPDDAPIDGTTTVVFTDGEDNKFAIDGEVVKSDSDKAAFNKELDDAMNEWIKSPNDPAALEKVRNLTNMLPGAINDPNQTKPFAMVERLKEMMARYPKFAPDELEHGLPAKGTFGSVNFAEGTVSAVGITGLDDLVSLAITAPPNAVFHFTLEDWITVRQQVSEGLDPVMLDFLRANADQFDPMRAEGDGVTLRSVGMANAALITANKGNKDFPSGSVWVAPKLILESLMTPKMAGDLIQFAKDKGLEVDTFVGKKLEFGADRDIDLPSVKY